MSPEQWASGQRSGGGGGGGRERAFVGCSDRAAWPISRASNSGTLEWDRPSRTGEKPPREKGTDVVPAQLRVLRKVVASPAH